MIANIVSFWFYILFLLFSSGNATILKKVPSKVGCNYRKTGTSFFHATSKLKQQIKYIKLRGGSNGDDEPSKNEEGFIRDEYVKNCPTSSLTADGVWSSDETNIQRAMSNDVSINFSSYNEDIHNSSQTDQLDCEQSFFHNLNNIGVNGGEIAIVETSFPEAASQVQNASADTYKKALLRTVLVVVSAAAFGFGTWALKGRQSALEFFASYLVEQSLSVDNLFVFIMLFEYFKVPHEFQNRVLTWGIIGAVSMRAVMILVGVAAIQRFRLVILAFAAILVVSSVKLLTEKEDNHDLSENVMLKLSKWFIRSSDFYDGEKFFTNVDGRRVATPLLLCLVCIELSDFVFAVDSIPAVLGVSKDSFIVYTSNVFAIMALRSLYILVNNAVTDLPYLKPSVALVLGFVGLKMCLEYFHYEISIGISLGVVATLLLGGIAASVWDNRRKKVLQHV